MCGVAGIFLPDEKPGSTTAVTRVHLMLMQLQHRGEEAAGLAACEPGENPVIRDDRDMAAEFTRSDLASLYGWVAMGHVRYPTTGSTGPENSQPIFGDGRPSFALAHNGNLTNHEELIDGHKLSPQQRTSDSRVIIELLQRVAASQRTSRRILELGLQTTLPRLQGAYSLIAMDSHHLIGARDPHGMRPLWLAKLADGWALASEEVAFRLLKPLEMREVEPGEMVIISPDGITTRRIVATAVEPAFCVFEVVYFSRPDSSHRGRSIQASRMRMGELLALQAPVEADIVIDVPNSGDEAARGYAKASGLPSVNGLLKSRYVGRTFTRPTPKERAEGVRQKLSPLDIVRGKRVVVVDDSIVRATTLKVVVAMLREKGATEIHLRIMFPPVRHPCYYGIDLKTREEMVANGRTVDEICELLGADSLEYLSLENLLEAVGSPDGKGFCTACVTGSYQIPTPRSHVPANLLPDSEPTAA